MRDLDLLSAFLEIYRGGSITAAASRLGLTQPAVSGRLARLEEQLGGPLFVRSRQGVSPTPRGDELARRVGPPIDQLRYAFAAEEGRSADLGTLDIGGAGELMAARVLPALAPLADRGLRLRVTLGLAEDLLSALANARLDLVVSAIRPDLKTLVVTPFVDEEFLLVGPPALARTVDAARLAEEPVKALAHLSLVAYGEELPIIRRYWRSEFGRRPPNRVSVVVPDLRAVLASVIAGAGVSVLPRYLTEPAVTAGSVEVLHEPEAPPLNTLYLATRPGALANPSLALVHNRLKERARTWGPL
ncbi:LysR family transcriptional regulator [Streptomyces sp. NPDC051569]|uniref:LysR family transcriptional regulator n=1 Tax=Streptomyces sp. NPDC051569 TaxID=3365661 RepID=UPI0037BB0B37